MGNRETLGIYLLMVEWRGGKLNTSRFFKVNFGVSKIFKEDISIQI